MFKELKQLAGHSFVYGFGSILSRTLNFFLLPLYTNIFSREEYGVASLVFTFLAFMNIIYHYGMDTAFLRFYAMEDNKSRKKIIFGTTFTSVLISSILFSLLMFGFSSRLAVPLLGSQENSLFLKWAAGIVLFDTLYAFPYLIMRIEEKSLRFALINILNVTINVSGNIILIVFLKMGIKGIFISNFVASAATFLICTHLLPGRLNLVFNKQTWLELIRFGLPYVPAGLASMIMEVIDRYMLMAMRTMEEVGLYSSGYKLGVFMLVVVMAFKFAWQPYFLRKSKNEPEAKRAFKLVMTYFLTVTLFLFLIISFFIDELLRVKIGGYTFFGKNFWDSTIVVPPVLMAYIFLGISVILMPGIYIRKKSGWIPLINGAGALTNIILNLILIPRMGIIGAAQATMWGYLTLSVIQFIIVQRFYPIKYEFSRISRLFLITGILFMLHNFFGKQAAMDVLLITSYPFLLFILRFFNQQEKEKFKSIFRRIKKRNSPSEKRG